MSLFNKVTKTFQWGNQSVTLETGEIARQSGGAVIVNVEDTVVLATVVAAKNAKRLKIMQLLLHLMPELNRQLFVELMSLLNRVARSLQVIQSPLQHIGAPKASCSCHLWPAVATKGSRSRDALSTWRARAAPGAKQRRSRLSLLLRSFAPPLHPHPLHRSSSPSLLLYSFLRVSFLLPRNHL